MPIQKEEKSYIQTLKNFILSKLKRKIIPKKGENIDISEYGFYFKQHLKAEKDRLLKSEKERMAEHNKLHEGFDYFTKKKRGKK